MPAFALSAEGAQVARFEVIGEHAADANSFVQHVGLHNSERRKVVHSQAVDVAHMGPPMSQAGQMRAHVAGRVPLDTPEITLIGTWIEKIADELSTISRRKQYRIDPPWEDVTDLNTGVRRYRRYSCAGFVIDAHRIVGIELLNLEEASRPEVHAQTLRSVYPTAAHRDLQDFGLHGDGPWRVVLPGYVIHSLNRPGDEIRSQPYQVQPGNERF